MNDRFRLSCATPARAAAVARAHDLFDEIKKLEKLDSAGVAVLYELLGDWWCKHCGTVRHGPCYCMADD